jgi:hypothetical protein
MQHTLQISESVPSGLKSSVSTKHTECTLVKNELNTVTVLSHGIYWILEENKQLTRVFP